MKKITALILALVMIFAVVPFTASAADDENIATMWICAEQHNKTSIWHIFLYFKNNTDETIKVGKYDLAPYDTVSVGCFGTEGPRGSGVYYNLESDLTHYSHLVGLSTELNESELSAVSKKMRSFGNWWDPIFNCYYFASVVWNQGGGRSVPFLIFPGFGRFFILNKGGGSMNVDLFADKPVYRYNEL